MKTAFKKGSRVVVRDVELRALRSGEVRLRVTACGICGGDLAVGADRDERETPFGHEVAGTVIETAADVSALPAGRRIVLESSSACGRCANCRNGLQELCSDIKSFFNSGTFGFAEEMIAPAVSAIPCEDLDPAVATLSEPLAVAIDMVRLAEVGIRSNVLIIGAGPIGLMALALVRLRGARRVVVSGFRRSRARWELAKAFGADEMIDPTETPLEEADFGCDIHRVIVTAPPPVLADAFAVAAKGGIISFVGIGHGEDAFCRFDVNRFHFKKLQLRASFTSPALYTPQALDLLREGKVDGDALISHRFPLAEISGAMETARNKAEAVKVVVTP